MSASLVGSEMCIRDRPTPAEGRALPPQINRTTQPTPNVHRINNLLPGACLLYTSDAADDM
eukprot:753404-Alexandrium_andersonii.AAC.1